LGWISGNSFQKPTGAAFPFRGERKRSEESAETRKRESEKRYFVDEVVRVDNEFFAAPQNHEKNRAWVQTKKLSEKNR
jgi:hypothetical protein